MFDIAWTEILVVAAVAVMVFGPRELPMIMRAAGKFFRRLQSMRYEFTRQFDDLMRDTEIEELRRETNARIMSSTAEDEAEADADELFSLPEEEKNDKPASR